MEFGCASVWYNKGNFSFLLLCFVTWTLQWLHDCCSLLHSLCQPSPARAAAERLHINVPGCLHTPAWLGMLVVQMKRWFGLKCCCKGAAASCGALGSFSWSFCEHLCMRISKSRSERVTGESRRATHFVSQLLWASTVFPLGRPKEACHKPQDCYPLCWLK